MIHQESVQIVIVTYNGMAYIDACLSSCDNYQVVVVDNASTDDTVSFIKDRYPQVKVIEQTENLGFGQANNIGIAHSISMGMEHVLLLNQDAYLIDDCLSNLILFQKKNPEYGILSPIHLRQNQKLLDPNFAEYVNQRCNTTFYDDYVLGNTIQDIYEVPFVNAATWLISATCIQKVGGFDPIFFHYGEDNNYCQRVRYHDYKIGVLTKGHIIHDRPDRTKRTIEKYSSAYFAERENQFKVKFANINDVDALFKLETKLKILKRHSLKSLLKLDMEDYKSYKTEYQLLKSIESDILRSMEINKIKAPHYLNL